MATKVKKIDRTSGGLREALFDEIDGIRAGESNPHRAQAVAKLACQIINSVRAEIEFHSHVRGMQPGDDMPLGKMLQLGGTR